MDAFAKDLHSAIVERNLSHVVDVIVVSDHGMTSTSNERLVYLDDVLGEDGFKAIEHKEGKFGCEWLRVASPKFLSRPQAGHPAVYGSRPM